MNKILFRSAYKNDYELIKYWIQNPLIKEKIKKIKILPKKKIKIIVSDNIRVGMRIKKENKEYYFIYPNYYTLGYLSKKFIHRVYGKNCEDINNFYKEIKKNNNIENILLSKKKIKNSKKKLLILGNKSRNNKLVKYLKKRNHNVKISNQYLSSKDLINKKYDYIVSSGYPFKINDKIVSKYAGRILNLHATFLPWGKGIGTTLFSFLLKHPTGLSIHLIDKKFDTGDIIFRKFLMAKKMIPLDHSIKN